MKKLLLIVTFFLTFTSFSQDLDTVIIKNNNTYRFEKTSSKGGLSMTNETTRKKFLELPGCKATENDRKIEGERAVNYMKRGEGITIFDCFLNGFKETFKDYNFKNFNHVESLIFFIYINSKGDIVDVKILLNTNFLNIVGYDGLIEFERRIKLEYKFEPLVKQEIGKFGYIIVRLNPTQLNSAFK